MLTSAELASMRDTLDQSLPGTAVISRYTTTPDGQGGGTELAGTPETLSTTSRFFACASTIRREAAGSLSALETVP